ncbi:hypothetical protein HYALB_00011845 [Hymenoscyphus albidus]|uniref:Uncharacterized protein n=1 Tax=Hymenoscyphus albidus TaxID=595503 RepID=A0A9N9Q9X8_9HELO|nr:hypothetical protein HYALB_00011845 [Hymenoscyphus albidus]
MSSNVPRSQMRQPVPETWTPEPFITSAVPAHISTVGSQNSATSDIADCNGYQPHTARSSIYNSGKRLPAGSWRKKPPFENPFKLGHPGIILSIDEDACQVGTMGSREDGASMEIVDKPHQPAGSSNHLFLKSEEGYDFNRVANNNEDKKESKRNGDFVHLRYVETVKLSYL